MAYCKMRFAAFASLLFAVDVGITATYSATAIENMSSDTSIIKPSENEKGWIASIMGLGAFCGGIFAGFLSEKIGRKGVMMIASAPFTIGWFFIAFAHSLTPILAGRFITGFCCGLICVVTPMYLVEISLPECRGAFGSHFQLYISYGVVIVSCLGKVLSWNWLAFSGAIITVIAVTLMCLVPESPRWLVTHKQVKEATEAIQFLRGPNTDASEEFMAINESLIADGQNNISVCDLYKPAVYKPALLSFGLVFFQQFSGSNAILFYTVFIFKQAGSSIESGTANILVATVMLAFTGLSSYSVDIFGRRKLLFISGFIMFLSLCILGTFTYLDSAHLRENFGWVPLFSLMLYIAAFSFGFGPIPWLMMAEMSPMKFRAVICGTSTALCWILVFIITKSFISLQSVLDDYTIYWIYAGFCLISCYFTFAFLPETKGKTLEEIARYFTLQPNMEPLEDPPLGFESI